MYLNRCDSAHKKLAVSSTLLQIDYTKLAIDSRSDDGNHSVFESF